MAESFPLDEAALCDHSRSFAQALFSAHPSWKNFARMDKSHYGKHMILLVTVEPPEASKAEYSLIIDTDNDEITVGFDAYHSHFEWPSFDGEYDNPLRFIDDIVEERTVVVSIWSGEKWALSTTLDPSKSLGEISRIPDAATFAKVRSWRGTYSRNVPLPLRSGSPDR